MCTRAFVMLCFLSEAHLRPDPKLVFSGKGMSYYLIPGKADYDSTLLYRVSPDGALLVANCSRPETLLQGYDVRCRDKENRMRMENLTVGQSGDYRYEEWRGGDITDNRSFLLTVCEKYEYKKMLFVYEGSGVLCRADSALGKGSSILVYKDRGRGDPVLALDTDLSPEPIQEDLRGRLQADLNASLVRYSEFNEIEPYKFYCTFRKKTHCHTVIGRALRILPKYVFGRENKNLTLPCVFRWEVPGQVNWSTPIGYIRLSDNQTLQQEVMYMLNGSQTGDYSLIIPSMSQQHRGEYRCKGHNRRKAFDLFFCTTVSPLLMMFSHGDSVRLDVAADNHSFIIRDSRFHWYRQKDLQSQVLIVDSRNRSLLVPEDLRGRVTVERYNYSLLISNLTTEDSGFYMWRYSRKVRDVCAEREINLVYRDPFGVDSGFYRVYGSLLGCVLLGLVAAVIWLKLRSRGVLTSGGQEMEMQDIGDDDVYDDVEEAEGIGHFPMSSVRPSKCASLRSHAQ